jgi:hypothetical protein
MFHPGHSSVNADLIPEVHPVQATLHLLDHMTSLVIVRTFLSFIL